MLKGTKGATIEQDPEWRRDITFPYLLTILIKPRKVIIDKKHRYMSSPSQSDPPAVYF